MAEPEIDRSSRFAKIPEALLCDPSLPDVAVRVFGALHRFGKTPDRCFPSIKRIAQTAGTNQTAVKRGLNALEAGGWIRRVSRFTAGGLKTSNGYELHQVPMGRNRTDVGSESNHHEARKPSSHDGSESNYRWVETDPTDGSKSNPTDGSESNHEREPVQPEPSNESSSGTQTSHAPRDERPPRSSSFADQATEELFRDFWNVFPYQVREQPALRAFRQALGHATPETIIDGARVYAEHVATTKPSFVHYPDRWLNEKLWTDNHTLNLPKSGWDTYLETYGAQTATAEQLGLVRTEDGRLIPAYELGLEATSASAL